jgi:hypothetical protein
MQVEKVLSQFEVERLVERFPDFELSYETISHKKVSPNYNLAYAIPNGNKYYAWFSFYEDKDVLYLLNLNKDKKITKISIVPCKFNSKLALGTIVYGVLLQDTNTFLIEDIYYFKGIPLKRLNTREKLHYVHELFDHGVIRDSNYMNFALPVFWIHTENMDFEKIPEEIQHKISYTIHHIQYRSFIDIVPFINIPLNRKIITDRNKNIEFVKMQEKKKNFPKMEQLIPDYHKPQYRQNAVFLVSADIQYDIYHLFAYGKNKSLVYYDVAYIPNYKTSTFMNGLFRTIKENKNLDYIEESDDETDFEDMREDKYVDLQKQLFMECQFIPKFKRWVPKRVVDPSFKVVHIMNLVRNYNQQ